MGEYLTTLGMRLMADDHLMDEEIAFFSRVLSN